MPIDANFFPRSLATAIAGLMCAAGMSLAFPANAQSLGVCNSFYPANFALTQGKVNPATSTPAKPAKGVLMKEPSFGTCLVRATAHGSEPPTTFARNDYSRRQAFNANSTYFIVYSADGWWHLYDANTLKYLRKLSPKVANESVPAEFHMAGDAEPQWDTTNPNILYYVPNNGGTKLLKLDVRTNSYSIAADFKGKLPAWGNSAAHIWTKSEGSPSADSRYWGFQVENSSFGLLGYMVWDLQNNRLVGSRQDSQRPDHSSMSAAGRWFVTSSDDTGTWAWSPDFSKKKKLHNKSEHSDLALGPNGEDYYVSVDYQSQNGDVFYTNIDTCPAVAASATTAPVCPRTVLFPSYDNGAATAMHFSGKGFNKPGWMVWSTYGTTANRSGVWPWFTNKIYVVELKANPRVYALAYTRRNESAGGYWSEPHASVNRDFTRIAFNSNWGVNDAEDIDTYQIQIPVSALPGGLVTVPEGPRHITGGNLPPVLGSNNNNVVSAGSPALPLVTPPPATSVPTATADSNQLPTTPASTAITSQRLPWLSRTWLRGRAVARLWIMSILEPRPLAMNSPSRVAAFSLPGLGWIYQQRAHLDSNVREYEL
ncbi:hypothetical protein [Pseudoxanthomonas dokdonensis]|uniref:hypothetical protein n=1 Tax=Pseudoxanthomonas dokdonensis TaxID=344882 RepID=UPI000710D2F6|nr:hypothetical protein [Pseudoxanthomonas dokdonensis]